MNTTARRSFTILASTLIVCSSLALPSMAHARHGMNCGFIQTGPNTYTWVCSRGV